MGGLTLTRGEVIVILSLQTYFDLGVSYGLGDGAFEPIHGGTVPDILGIGIRNPLGLGRTAKLADGTMEVWRRASVKKVDAPEMELGFEDLAPDSPGFPSNFEEFKASLKSLIAINPVKECNITICAIGVVFLRIDFEPNVPLPLASGILHCFEFAGYSKEVSEAILADARRLASRSLKRPRRRWWRFAGSGIGISSISKRPDPEVETDDKGYSELRLFTAFTHLALCTDPADNVEAIKARILPKREGSSELDCVVLPFEYHGKIHFNWAASVVEPRSFEKQQEPPDLQIRRILMCVQIAHTFQGAVEAFNNLFLREVRVDAEGFIRGEAAGLDYVQLNRLRTLALAVIGLTKFEGVTQTQEDRDYFRAYDRSAQLDKIHENILSNSEVLSIVQKGEFELEQEHRADWFNTLILFLTGFTALTVLKDVYEFLKSDDTDIGANVVRKIVRRRPRR